MPICRACSANMKHHQDSCLSSVTQLYWTSPTYVVDKSQATCVVISSVDEYLFSWDEPHVQETYSAHILALTTPQVLEKDTRYAVQVIIPDLSFMRPTIESPVDILAGTTAPELVWQLPRAYSLEKTLTPFTYEVQVRGVGHSRSALAPVPDRGRSTSSSRGTTTEEEETRWRVLETNVKRTRLTLGRLDPEKEFWLRVVAVTDYGRGAPSQPVRKLVDLAATMVPPPVFLPVYCVYTVSPTFIEPKGQIIYAPIGGHLELKSCLQPMRYDPEIRFSWFLNEKPININGTLNLLRSQVIFFFSTVEVWLHTWTYICGV
ncbi:hypothetical protein AHF37_09058 [Paragonimus kellicotti]|nr:hypothetical protein AHF37_09058 [Paragonimus kellicotti]